MEAQVGAGAPALLPVAPARPPASDLGEQDRAGRAATLTGSLAGGVDPRLVWAGLLGVSPVATAGCALALTPLWHSHPGLALAITALFAGLFAMGVALLGEPGQRRPGVALLLSALTLVLAWAEEWDVGPFPALSAVLGNQWLVLGAWALYRYPDARLQRWDRWFFGVMAFWMSVPALLVVLVSRPDWHNYHADVWWPTLSADRRASDVVQSVSYVGLGIVAALYLLSWARRLRSIRPVERRLRIPPAIAAIVATTAAALVPTAQALGADENTMTTVYILEAVAIVAVPIAFLVAILRRQLARTRVTDLILGIKGPPSTDAVVSALRTALEDPGLELAYWSSPDQAYTSPSIGQVTPDSTGGRLAATVETTRGVPLALVLADPALVRDPDLLTAAATVAGFSLEIARLLETVRRQLEEVQAAGARAVQAADAERRRLAQDLHDGAQQHLLALGPLIGAAEASTTDPETALQLGEIRELLTRALKELREFAHGVHPSALAHGLATAVQELTRTLPISAEVDLPPGDLPKETAHAAYLVISEALANAAKHARAQRVYVSGTLRDGVLDLEVRDDGIGGAHANAGLGIATMSDRVAALGGRIALESRPGKGTVVRLSLPCA